MLVSGRFALDDDGEVAMPETYEIRYLSGRGDVWHESDRFFWFGQFDGREDHFIDMVLIRPGNQPAVHKEAWPLRFAGTAPPLLVRIGPISFMPINWGRHLIEIRVHGAPVQRQRVDVIRCD